MKAIQVEVFSSPGCSRCGQVFDLLQTITRDLGAERIDWREVNVLDELDYAVELRAGKGEGVYELTMY